MKDDDKNLIKKTSGVITEITFDELNQEEFEDLMKLNLLKPEICLSEVSDLNSDISNILSLRLLKIPGYFEDLPFQIKDPDSIIHNIVSFINEGNYRSINEGILDLLRNTMINILSGAVGKPIDLFEIKDENFFEKEHIIDSSEYMFGCLGEETVIDDLYDYSEIYSNILQYNAFNYHDQFIIGKEYDKFRVYPSSMLQIRDLLINNSSFANNFDVIDYMDILDSESVILTVEYWGGQIGEKHQDVLGYVYYSYANTLKGTKNIIFSEDLEELFNSLNLDALERNNRVRDEDIDNIKRIMRLM